jgi:tetratricopeptide (TPR) repeat protein
VGYLLLMFSYPLRLWSVAFVPHLQLISKEQLRFMSSHQIITIGFALVLSFLGILPASFLMQPAWAHEMHDYSHFEPPAPGSLFLNPEQDLQAEQLFTQGLDKLQVNDYQGALADFDQSLALARDEKVYLRRGELRQQLGDLPGAEADYTEVLKIDSNTYAHYQRGHVREALGDLQGALADYTEAIELYPNDGYGYSFRGALYTRMGNFAAASKDLSLALQYNSDRPEAYFYRGELRQKVGNDRGAISDYQRATILFTEQGKLSQANMAFNAAAKLEQRTATKLQPDLPGSSYTVLN